ncbi:MAG TPA: hypothetical protein VIE69_09045 [Methylophilaceae bacterium]|jgi:hypothetical protein
MKPEILFELLAEVEKEDPIDFSRLPFAADDLRQLACLDVSELIDNLTDETAAQREIVIATAMVRLVLENLVLNARISLLDQQE